MQRFEVTVGSPLPAARLVLAQRSIVKLHGGQFGLRADYSLDQRPSEEDVANFLGYLSGRPRLILGTRTPADRNSRVALLVTGVGIREERTRGLLRAAFHEYRCLRIFWLAFTKEDEEQFKQFWEELNKELSNHDGDDERDRRCYVRVHPEHALLLLHLYQHCVHDLPPAGTPFPALWNYPFPPLIPKPKRKQSEELLEAHLAEVVRRINDPHPQNPLVIQSRPGVYGAVTLGAAAFDHESLRGWFKIWLDLEDLACPEGVLFRIQLTLAKRCGIPDPIVYTPLDQLKQGSTAHIKNPSRPEQPGNRTVDDENLHAHTEHLSRTTQQNQATEQICDRMFDFASQLGQRCVVFLNAQQGPGKNSFFETLTNNWVERENLDQLFDQLDAVSRDNRFEMRFVVLCTSAGRTSSSSGALAEARDPSATFFQTLQRHRVGERWIAKGIKLNNDLTDFDPEKIVQRALKWGRPVKWRWWLLYTLTRYRIGRYVANVSHTVHRLLGDLRAIQPKPTYQDITDALNRLCDLGLLRRKHGGILWMHYHVRNLLEQRLLQHANRGTKPRLEDELRLVKLICRGYGRMLLSAAEPMPAFEAIRHVLQTLRDAANMLGTSLTTDGPQGVALRLLQYAQLLAATVDDLLERRVTDQLIDLMLEDVTDRASKLLADVRRDKQWPEELKDSLFQLLERLTRLRLRTLQHQSDFDELLKCLGPRETHTKLALERIDEAERACFRAAALIGLRCYDGANDVVHAALRKLLSEVLGDDQPVNQIPDPAHVIVATYKKFGVGSSKSMALIKRASLLATRLGYSILNQSEAEYLCGCISKVDGRSPRPKRVAVRLKALQESKQNFEFALAMLRDIGRAGHTTFRPNTRIRAHLALTHALIARLTETGDGSSETLGGDLRWLAAIKTLSDAEAYVIEYPAPADALSRGILEMRRAEFLYIQATTIGVIRRVRSKIRKHGGFGPSDLGKDPMPQLEKVQAFVFEALRALERGEGYLESYPKSRWWWWILIVLRVQCAEALLLVRFARSRLGASGRSAGDEGVSEGASRNMPPDLRVFINEGILHAVRVHYFRDFFRMATLVSAYQGCLVAQIRQGEHLEKILEREDPDRPVPGLVGYRLQQLRGRENVEKGRDNLRKLADHLGELLVELRKRDDRERRTDRETSKVSGAALAYAEAVLASAKAFPSECPAG